MGQALITALKFEHDGDEGKKKRVVPLAFRKGREVEKEWDKQVR
jgi:hypothetical protein